MEETTFFDDEDPHPRKLVRALDGSVIDYNEDVEEIINHKVFNALVCLLEDFFSVKCPLPASNWCYPASISVLPNITVGSSCKVSYPCNEDLAKRLSNVAIGNMIEAESVHISSKAWLALFGSSTESSLLQVFKTEFAPRNKKPITASLISLLVLEKDSSSFQLELDLSPTVLVVLPSDFTGGDFVVQGPEKPRHFCLSNAENDNLVCKAVGISAGSVATIEPVASGCFVALLYRLNSDPGEPKPPSTLIKTFVNAKLQWLVDDLFANLTWKDCFKFVGIALRGNYSGLDRLSPEDLQGYDRSCYEAICSSGKYQIKLIPIKVQACGESETWENQRADRKQTAVQSFTNFVLNYDAITKFKICGDISGRPDEEIATFRWSIGTDLEGDVANGLVRFVSDWRTIQPRDVITESGSGYYIGDFDITFRSFALIFGPKSLD